MENLHYPRCYICHERNLGVVWIKAECFYACAKCLIAWRRDKRAVRH